MKSKVMKLEEAIGLIKDGDSIATAMANNAGNAEYLMKGLEDRFLSTNSPKGLTKYSGCGTPSDARLIHPGLLKKYVGAHPGPCIPIMKLIDSNSIEAYGLPQGVMQHMYRCTASKAPGLLTKTGMGTYVDPRQEGGRLNEAAKDNVCRIMQIDGEDWLFYKSFNIDVALIRVTTADEYGNATVEEEINVMEAYTIAAAVKSCGGKVILQTKYLVAGGALNAKNVSIPAEVVDAVVVVEEPELYHKQTLTTYYDPYFSGELIAPQGAIAQPPEVLNVPEIISRRAVYELFEGAIVNVGLGVGVGVGSVAAVENMADRLTFTIETGVFGGTPEPKNNFGAAINATCYLDHPAMFDFYNGGNLDITFLGVAEVGADGSVNVSRFGDIKAGRAQGGFIDITTTAKKIVFCSTFKSVGMKVEVANGKLKIIQEGKEPKFIEKVDQITFNGEIAAAKGQEVVYVTERCVFKLTKDGVMLTEIAPGVDMEKDIFGQMGFRPIVSEDLRVMDERIFIPGRMGCFD